jgi:uncharacterized lipoprotein YmbA
MIRNKYWLLILALLLLGCARTQPTARIYDAKADAHRDVAGAIATTGQGEKNVVLIFGADW